MTEARRRVKILLLEKHMVFSDLAALSGLSEATVHNVLDDRASSAKSKQAITNAVGTEIWPGISPTERSCTFPVGTEIDCVAADEAAAIEEEFAGFVRRDGNRITFTKTTTVFVSVSS